MLRNALHLTSILVLIACNALPEAFPTNAARKALTPLDQSKVVVKRDLKVAPSLTAIVLPADVYVPVRKNATGTFYESPRGILLVPVAGSPSVMAGGIYRSNDPAKRFQLSIYGAPIMWPLDVRYGTVLKGNVECTPDCEVP